MASFIAQYETLDLLERNSIESENKALRSIWELDERIRNKFIGVISMYEQGLLHSIEFYKELTDVLNAPNE